MPQLPPCSMRFLTGFWAIGTVLCSAVSIANWTYGSDGVVRVGANLASIFALPGWIPLYAVGLRGIRDHPLGIIAATGIAWGFWCVLIAVASRVHARWAGTRPRVSGEPVDYSRRAFMANGVLGIGAVGAVASPAYATLIEPWSIRVQRYTVPIRDLPASFEGLRLVQFSDPHLGPRIPASFVEQAVRRVIQLRPDVLLLTGDYIHDDQRDIDPVARLCKPMIDSARYGAVGVLGNHDWWGDGARMSGALRALGVRMIDNDRVWLDPGTGALTPSPTRDGLAFVGLGDLTEDVVDEVRAFSGVGAGTARIVLAHQPDTAELGRLTRSGAPRIDLMCSGHTHGGQVRIPFVGTPIVPSRYGSKYAGGLVRGPAFPVVVSRGIGMSLLPVRFGVPPEIVEITLTRA